MRYMQTTLTSNQNTPMIWYNFGGRNALNVLVAWHIGIYTCGIHDDNTTIQNKKQMREYRVTWYADAAAAITTTTFIFQQLDLKSKYEPFSTGRINENSSGKTTSINTEQCTRNAHTHAYARTVMVKDEPSKGEKEE